MFLARPVAFSILLKIPITFDPNYYSNITLRKLIFSKLIDAELIFADLFLKRKNKFLKMQLFLVMRKNKFRKTSPDDPSQI